VGRRRVRLVHRHLQLTRPPGHDRQQVAVHRGDVRDRPAVFDCGPVERHLIQAERPVRKVEAPPGVTLGQRGRRAVELRPGQGHVSLAQRRGIPAVRGRVHVLTRVDRIEGEARGGTAVDVLRRLEVVGVRADRRAPAPLKCAPQRVIHHIVRRPARARHLADGLLCEDHGDGVGGVAGAHLLRSAHVARRRDAQPVAAARGGRQSQRNGPQPGQRVAQRGRIGVRQRAQEQVAACCFAPLPRKVWRQRGACRSEHAQTLVAGRQAGEEVGGACTFDYRTGVHG